MHGVLQARDGLLWIATEGGLARFDGFRFTSFGQRTSSRPLVATGSDDLCCVVQDRDRTLWVGTAAGLVRMEGGALARVGDTGPPAAAVKAMAAAGDGSVLVLSTEGLLRERGGQLELLAYPEAAIGSATAIAAAPDGGVLIAGTTGLARYGDGAVSVLPITLPSSGAVLGLAAGATGELWLRTARELLWVEGGRTRRSWQAGRDLPGTRIEALLPERGGIWVGTNRGLVQVVAGGAVSVPVPELSTASVLSLTRDTEGDLWVGTETAGIHILRPQRFRTLPGLDDKAITSVVEATDGDLWLGTREDGLLRVHHGVVEHPAATAKLASQVILSLAAGPQDDLWVGTPDGLNHLLPGGRVDLLTSANGLPDDFIRSLLVDPDGALSIGTRRGFAHMANGVVDQVISRDDGLPSELVGALLRTPAPGSSADDKNTALWIATLGGLSRLRNGQLQTFTTRDGLAGDVVTSLAADGAGGIWIGSRDGGLTLWRADRFRRFSQPGMPSSVESILLDGAARGAGSVWMGTRHGVVRVPLASLESCADQPACVPSISRYGYSDGLPSEEISALGHPAATRTRSGELCFATPRGLAIADAGETLESSVPTPIILEGVEVDDAEQAIPDASAPPLRIGPGHRSIAITYAGLSYRAPSRVTYRYRLEGFDRQWVEAGTRRTAFYTNLASGSYRFVVEAADHDGAWSPREATLAFRIFPPFYRRWWFYLLCLALLGGLAYLVYYLRLRHVRAQFDAVLGERNRIAREIHDTLAQDLVGISLQLDVTAQLLGRADPAVVAEHLRSTRRLVQEGITEARESIWELRATTARSSLPSRLERVVERANQRGTETTLTVSGAPRSLPTRWESEILRVAGEAVTNSMRHADPNTIEVLLDYLPNQLLLTVRDDGRGFDTGRDPGGAHFGMRGMRERASNIHGRLQVESAPGKGTVVTLAVALGETHNGALDGDPEGKKEEQHG